MNQEFQEILLRTLVLNIARLTLEEAQADALKNSQAPMRVLWTSSYLALRS